MATLDFFDIDAQTTFDLPPAQAVEFMARKGLKTSFVWQDVYADQHSNAFTVAKMMDLDLLSEVFEAVNSAILNGDSFAMFSERLIPLLQDAGWWGKKDLVDPVTGNIIEGAQLGSARRLETIFRTNLQSSYAAGQWQQMQEQAEDAPYLMYEAIDDFRTRPEHAAWDNKVLPINSKWWHTHYPPNGWNCRCTTIQLDADDLESFGLKVEPHAPRGKYRDWLNPRTGKTERVPEGIDPGFEFNAGKRQAEELKQLLDEKIDALPPKIRKAVRKRGG